jgi:hypothetical protein
MRLDHVQVVRVCEQSKEQLMKEDNAVRQSAGREIEVTP